MPCKPTQEDQRLPTNNSAHKAGILVLETTVPSLSSRAVIQIFFPGKRQPIRTKSSEVLPKGTDFYVEECGGRSSLRVLNGEFSGKQSRGGR